MPSASAKPEKPTSQEIAEPLKVLVTVVDKKIRKLEKKKGKIESIQANLDKGLVLHEDQKVAVSKYEEVVHSLEFAKELQKQFYQISIEYAKTQRKQAKQELIERQNYQLMRIREILCLQELLNNLGLENVRQDFLMGNNGAVILNEEELDKLDELYKLISPTREAGDYAENLKAAAEHILFVLDGRKKNVLEKTTYKDLKELITKIEQCPYFDKSAQEIPENGEAIEVIAEEPMEQEIIEQSYVIPSSEAVESQQHKVQSSLEETTQNLEEPQVAAALHVVNSTGSGLANSYFSNAPYTQPCAVHESLPNVQDNFNFLQESQIDLESPHMDPAVVAAHPMTPSQTISYSQPSQTDSSTLQFSQQTFQNQNASVTTLATPDTDLQPKPQRSSSTSQQVIGPSVNQPLKTQTFTNQNYVMAAHTLIGSGPSPTQTLPHPNHTSSSQPDTTPNAPTPIPLPNQQQLLQQQNAGVATAALSAPKQYPMNVNAAAFQAVGLKQSPHESALSLQQITGSQLQNQQQQLADLHGGFQHSQSQQNSGFSRPNVSSNNNNNSNNSNNNRGGRGVRGSGRSGSSNGYNRGSGRGNYSNSRGNGRFGGNGSLQNLQSRDNYFQSSYQPRDNFSGSGNFGNDYKRGNASQQRGNARGGIRGNQNRDNGSTRGGRGRYNKIQQTST